MEDHNSSMPSPVPVSPQKSQTKRFVGLVAIVFFGLSFAYLAFSHPSVRQFFASGSPTLSPEGTDQYTPDPSGGDGSLQVATDFTEMVDVQWERVLLVQPKKPICGNDEYCETLEFYLAGKILSGIYANEPLYIEEVRELGTSYRHYIVENNQRKYLQDLKIGLKGIDDIPNVINFPLKSGYKLKKSYYAYDLFSEIKVTRKVFTDPVLGDFFLTEDGGCLIVELPNHLAIAYDLQIPFVNLENGKVNMTFLNGASNKDFYGINRIIGCGALCYYLAVVDNNTLKPSQRLYKIGTTSTNEDIYGIINPNDTELRKLYDDENTVAYFADGFQKLPTNKYSYAEYIALQPLMYWQDPMGRWIEFKNNKFVTAAEMCKPVIYLYPPKSTEMTVRVHPNGGFTFTEPAYDDGWHVMADPDGQIKDLKTGKMHDYLFWEGIGLNYPEENKGWSVKRENLSQFFDEKLTILGLKGRELQDFKEYWLGRLVEKPYYKLTFLKKEQFDKIAPLEVSESPNVAIRIMMTAQGLDQPLDLQPQELQESPARVGFTLVEWGGVVLK